MKKATAIQLWHKKYAKNLIDEMRDVLLLIRNGGIIN